MISKLMSKLRRGDTSENYLHNVTLSRRKHVIPIKELVELSRLRNVAELMIATESTNWSGNAVASSWNALEVMKALCRVSASRKQIRSGFNTGDGDGPN